MTPGVIRAAYERAGFYVTEAELLGRGFEILELVGRHIALDTELAGRWLEILSDSDDVDVVVS
jgi:hypothetical protein